MSDESIKPPSTSNKMLNPSVNYVGTKARAKFNGDCLKQDKITFDHGKIVNIYIVSEIGRSVNISSYSALENCLFGAVKLTKLVDVYLYKHSGYGIIFKRKRYCLIGNDIGIKVIIFGVDISLSPHIDNKKKGILILSKGPAQGLEHALQKNCIQPTLQKKMQNFVWTCIIIEQIVIYFLMVQKFLNSKQKILKLQHIPCV